MPTTEQVWDEIDKAIFGVLAFVNAAGEPRSAGVIYVTDGRSLLISSGKDAWKVRHIAANPMISMTVTIPKRIPLLPFVKIPAATITFQGEAEILEVPDVDPSVTARLFRGLELDRDTVEDTRILRVIPRGEFVTYGVAMPTMRMREPAKARGRASCGTEQETLRTAS